MIISTRGRYALRIMTALAASGKSSSLRELASAQDVPYKYAESIVSSLVKAGFVESSRGKNGGYKLTRPPQECTAADILRVTETSFAAASCTAEDADCPRAERCPTLPMWRALDDAVDELLKQYTLQDFINEA